MEQYVLVKKTSTNPVITTFASRELDESIVDNISSMTHQFNEQNMEILRLKMELEQSKRKITTPMINTVPFETFIGYVHVVEDDLYIIRLKFY